MPVQSSIPLAVRPPEPISPTQTMGELLALENLRLERAQRADDLRRREDDARRRAKQEADESVLRGAIAEFTNPETGVVNYDRVVSALNTRGAGDLALRLNTDLWRLRGEQAEAERRDTETMLDRFRLAKTIVGSISDEATHAAARTAIGQYLGEPYAQALGSSYDPKTVAQAGALADEFLNHLGKQAEAAERYAALTRERLQGQKSLIELYDTAQQAAVSRLAVARTPEEYATFLQGLPSLGIPDEIVRSLPSTFDPKTTPQLLTRLGLTMHQRVTTDETRRSHLANEAADRARLTQTPTAEAVPSEVLSVIATIGATHQDLPTALAAWRARLPELTARYPQLDTKKAVDQLSSWYPRPQLDPWGDLITPPPSAQPAAATPAPDRPPTPPQPATPPMPPARDPVTSRFGRMTPAPASTAPAASRSPERQVGDVVEIRLNAEGRPDPQGTWTPVRIDQLLPDGRFTYTIVRRQ